MKHKIAVFLMMSATIFACKKAVEKKQDSEVKGRDQVEKISVLTPGTDKVHGLLNVKCLNSDTLETLTAEQYEKQKKAGTICPQREVSVAMSIQSCLAIPLNKSSSPLREFSPAAKEKLKADGLIKCAESGNIDCSVLKVNKTQCEIAPEYSSSHESAKTNGCWSNQLIKQHICKYEVIIQGTTPDTNLTPEKNLPPASVLVK